MIGHFIQTESRCRRCFYLSCSFLSPLPQESLRLLFSLVILVRDYPMSTTLVVCPLKIFRLITQFPKLHFPSVIHSGLPITVISIPLIYSFNFSAIFFFMVFTSCANYSNSGLRCAGSLFESLEYIQLSLIGLILCFSFYLKFLGLLSF